MNINKFRDECKISTWLISIAKNLYFDELKRSKKNVDINEIGNYKKMMEAFKKYLERKELEKPLNTKVTTKEISITERRKSIKSI